MAIRTLALALLAGVLAVGCGRPSPKTTDIRSPEQRQRDEAAQTQILQRRSAARAAHRGRTVH